MTLLFLWRKCLTNRIIDQLWIFLFNRAALRIEMDCTSKVKSWNSVRFNVKIKQNQGSLKARSWLTRFLLSTYFGFKYFFTLRRVIFSYLVFTFVKNLAIHLDKLFVTLFNKSLNWKTSEIQLWIQHNILLFSHFFTLDYKKYISRCSDWRCSVKKGVLKIS